MMRAILVILTKKQREHNLQLSQALHKKKNI